MTELAALPVLPIALAEISETLHSDATVSNCYAHKNITDGEGGMLATRNDPLDARAFAMPLHGTSRDASLMAVRGRQAH